MRFKKVEISAFRIYDRPEQATFDFTLKSGGTAEFISLYAPNGFGKTSFYDAVEWGMTNNIQRFWQNEVMADAIEAQTENVEDQVKVLRNTRSSAKTKSYVTITPDEGDPTTRFLKPHGNKKSDIGDKDKFVNKDFRKVILSQDWIAGFLREVDGEKRFELFMENPDLTDLNIYYREVKGLVSATRSKIDKLDENKRDMEAILVNFKEDNLLETINATINKLIAKGETLNIIEVSSSPKETLDLANLISERLVKLEGEITAAQNSSDLAAVGLSGNKDILGIDLYYEHRYRKVEKDAQIISLADIISRFEQQSKYNTELGYVLKQQEVENNALDALKQLLGLFPAFEIVRKDIAKKEEVKTKEQDSLTAIQTPLGVARKVESDLKNRIAYNYIQLSEAANKITNFPTLKVAFESLNNNILKCDQDIKNDGDSLVTENNNKKKIEKEIGWFRRQIADAGRSVYAELSDNSSPVIRNLVLDLLQKETALAQMETQSDDVNRQIAQLESFNKELEDFIHKGLELINRSETKDCPLCSQSYNSYKELSEKVAGNQSLDSTLQTLVKRKNDIVVSLNELKNEITGSHQKLVENLNTAAKDLDRRLSDTNKRIRTLKDRLAETETNRQKHFGDLSLISSELGGDSLEQYREKLGLRLAEFESLQVNLSEELKEAEEKLVSPLGVDQMARLKIKLLDEEILGLQCDEDYKMLVEWFKINEPNVAPARRVVQSRIDKLQTKIYDMSTRANTLKSLLEDLAATLSQFQLKELIAAQKECNTAREKLIQDISVFEKFVEDHTIIQAANLDKTALRSMLDTFRQAAQERVARFMELIDDYKALVAYNENLLPYLQSENAKISLAAINDELKFINAELLPLLENEKLAIKNHLEEKVKSFFYTGLINQLYNKIDPHPDYKAVEFKANFDEDSPSLDVLVTNENREQISIPNLYFSSAQINILSLSIFLASALNSEDYDCIFIDDPVQSMDSINVLATIDLIRSIVVNEKKQVILSTHDQNFHNLLKKKMPPRIFNSKFLELESFGKVKEDVN